jgi:hypothetical protein
MRIWASRFASSLRSSLASGYSGFQYFASHFVSRSHRAAFGLRAPTIPLAKGFAFPLRPKIIIILAKPNKCK